MICGLLNSPLLGVSIGSYQPETSAWITRTEAAGGTIPTATKDAVDAFVVSCKAAGIFTKFKRLNLFCGSNLTACLSPLVNTVGSTMDTNSGFVSGDYSEAGGLVGDGTSYLSTGLVPNTTLAFNNWHLSTYVSASSPTSRMDIGCFGHPSGNIQFRMVSNYNGSIGFIVTAGDYNGGGNPSFNKSEGVGITGHMLVSRKASNSMRVRNTSGSVNYQYNDAYAGIQALPTTQMYAMSDQHSGPTSHTLAGYSVGLGLMDGEGASYCSILQTFQGALGRAV